MKKIALSVVSFFLFAVPVTSFAAEHDHNAHGMHATAGSAHEEVVNGVKSTFMVQAMADAMKGMGMEMPAGMKETHHVSVSFKDAKTGKPLTEGAVKVKIVTPDKSEKVKDLMGMQGHFGADFDFAAKGKYGVMCKFHLKDGKTGQAKFWYTVK